jgi:hypothetical protein
MDDFVRGATNKVLGRDCLLKAARQLSDAADALGAPQACRHLLVDISAYCDAQRQLPSQHGLIQVIGFTREEVEQVRDEVASSFPRGEKRIDKVTLCWGDFVFINGKIRAIVQNPASALAHGAQSIFEYEGWTVEGYPLSVSEYCEWRVSNVARSIDCIVTSYNNLSNPKTFYKIGLVESRPA